MNVVITGASGYIGYHLALKYTNEGHNVIGIYNSANEDKINALKALGVTPIRADLRTTSTNLNEHIDLVIHCASLKGIVDGNNDPEGFYETNINTMLNAWKIGADCFCFISTGIAEKSNSPYAKSKLMCEEILADLCYKSNTRCVVLRCFNPIGTKHPLFIDRKNILHTLYECAKKDKTLTVFGDGVRDFINVSDLAEMTYDTLNGCDDKYIIKELGIGIATSVASFIHIFEECIGKALEKEHKPPRENDVTWSVAHHKINFSHTLRETIEEYINLNK